MPVAKGSRQAFAFFPGDQKVSTRGDLARSDEARLRADARFKKEERAKDGAKALTEYLENSRLVREKTERLRALRLAKEANDKTAELAKIVAGVKKAAKATRNTK